MHFEIVGKITDIELIAIGTKIESCPFCGSDTEEDDGGN